LNFYFYSITDNFFEIFNPQKRADNSFNGLLNPAKNFEYLYDKDNFVMDTTKLLIMLQIIFFAAYLWEIKPELSIFAFVFILFYLNSTGLTQISSARLMFEAWPAFLVFGKIKNRVSIGVIAIFYLILSFHVMYYFLTTFFV
jgi:hypothetical protein